MAHASDTKKTDLCVCSPLLSANQKVCVCLCFVGDLDQKKASSPTTRRYFGPLTVRVQEPW